VPCDRAPKPHKPHSVKSRLAAKVFNSSHAAQAAGTPSNRAKARFPLPPEAGSAIDGKEAAPERCPHGRLSLV
jgi:hypothetical protein